MVTVATVRDCFTGRAMARVMSLAMIVFMAAPVIAPAFGTAILKVGSWRWIFWGVATAATVVLTWYWAASCPRRWARSCASRSIRGGSRAIAR